MTTIGNRRMTRGIAAGVAIGATVAACFSRPSRSFDGGGTSDDGGADSAPGDGTNAGADAEIDAPASCMEIEFTESVANCGSWSQTIVSAGSAEQVSGQLRLTLLNAGSASASCKTEQPRVFERAILEVVAVVAGSVGSNEKTYFAVADAFNRWGIEWTYSTGDSAIGIAMACATGQQSVPRRWVAGSEAAVQLRRSGATLVVELGPAPTGPWTVFGICTPTDAALNAANVVVGTSHVSGATGTAVFNSLTLCP